ncbi:UNKNOWN [Stylonychia lemnae]|uniref:Uncharacterized protein n=1 Tax=Stylonychia lemnae TaxID=5949 RepID=A0A077ZX75_STYLE|nr:UNKNOWN [Stylonychia lemnae]|eukprot:CDW73842.1 UNKNOWN [Stylonychia lemnae]
MNLQYQQQQELKVIKLSLNTSFEEIPYYNERLQNQQSEYSPSYFLRWNSNEQFIEISMGMEEELKQDIYQDETSHTKANFFAKNSIVENPQNNDFQNKDSTFTDVLQNQFSFQDAFNLESKDKNIESQNELIKQQEQTQNNTSGSSDQILSPFESFQFSTEIRQEIKSNQNIEPIIKNCINMITAKVKNSEKGPLLQYILENSDIQKQKPFSLDKEKKSQLELLKKDVQGKLDERRLDVLLKSTLRKIRLYYLKRFQKSTNYMKLKKKQDINFLDQCIEQFIDSLQFSIVDNLEQSLKDDLKNHFFNIYENNSDPKLMSIMRKDDMLKYGVWHLKRVRNLVINQSVHQIHIP